MSFEFDITKSAEKEIGELLINNKRVAQKIIDFIDEVLKKI